MIKSGLTTHVLNLAAGRPGAHVPVEVWRLGPPDEKLAQAVTTADGRTPLLVAGALAIGVYELRFDVDSLFRRDGAGFYGVIPIRVKIDDPAQHYHVPLLVSPYGYSTYRGS